jgi:hypothetical protein
MKIVQRLFMGDLDFAKQITRGINRELNLISSIEQDYRIKLSFVKTFNHKWKKQDFTDLNIVMKKIKCLIRFNEKGTTELQDVIHSIITGIDKSLDRLGINEEEKIKLKAIRIRIMEAEGIFQKLSVIYSLQYAFFNENKDSLWKEKMNFHMFTVLLLREGALLGSGEALKVLAGIQKEVKDDLVNYKKMNSNKSLTTFSNNFN